MSNSIPDKEKISHDADAKSEESKSAPKPANV